MAAVGGHSGGGGGPEGDVTSMMNDGIDCEVFCRILQRNNVSPISTFLTSGNVCALPFEISL